MTLQYVGVLFTGDSRMEQMDWGLVCSHESLLHFVDVKKDL